MDRASDGTRWEQTHSIPGSRYRIQSLPPACEVQDFVTQSHFDFVHGITRRHNHDTVHDRRIFSVGGTYWLVSDVLRAERNYRFDVRFHLSARARGRVGIRHQLGTCIIQLPGLILAHAEPPNTSTEIENGAMSHGDNGKSAPPIVHIRRDAAHTAFHTVLYPFADSAPRIDMRRVLVRRHDYLPADPCAQALKVDVDAGGQRFSDLLFFAPRSKEAEWQFEGYRFNGDYLLLRLDEECRRVIFHASAGAELKRTGPQRLSRYQGV